MHERRARRRPLGAGGGGPGELGGALQAALSGARTTLMPKIIEALRIRDMADVSVWVGGIIP